MLQKLKKWTSRRDKASPGTAQSREHSELPLRLNIDRQIAEQTSESAPTEQGPYALEQVADVTFKALCGPCKSIISTKATANEFENSKSRTHHVHARSCKDAADSGCPICRTVWSRATDFGRMTDALDLKLQGEFSTWRLGTHGSMYETIPGWQPDRQILIINIGSIFQARHVGRVETFRLGDIAFSLTPADEYAWALQKRVDGINTGSQACWQTIEKWIDLCKNGCKCVGMTAGVIKPSRLIDVGTSRDDMLYIRSDSELPDQPEYICLSHRWGGESAKPLYDKSKRWSRREGLPSSFIDKTPFSLHERSKTFRDAVEVTRRLGKRYLWVDMLCIVQNDREDWEHEARRMGRIYMSSYLTIIADGAHDGTEGLFFDRKPGAVSPIVAKLKWFDEPSENHWMILAVDFWRETVTETNTGNRAWCLQERALSHAKIHFGRYQVAWECNSNDCCETFPYGLPGKPYTFQGTRFPDLSQRAGSELARILVKEGQEKEKDSAPPQYFVWSHMIEKYAQTDITKVEDRIPAITGLGEFFISQLGDVLIAGLWQTYLASQLLWVVDDGYRSAMINAHDNLPDIAQWQAKGRRNNDWPAPTWSWACLQGPIFMPRPNKENLLIDVRVMAPRYERPNSVDAFFHMRAELSVTGVVHKALLFWNSRWGKWSVKWIAVVLAVERSTPEAMII